MYYLDKNIPIPSLQDYKTYLLSKTEKLLKELDGKLWSF